jgi:hypothetical protein
MTHSLTNMQVDSEPASDFLVMPESPRASGPASSFTAIGLPGRITPPPPSAFELGMSMTSLLGHSASVASLGFSHSMSSPSLALSPRGPNPRAAPLSVTIPEDRDGDSGMTMSPAAGKKSASSVRRKEPEERILNSPRPRITVAMTSGALPESESESDSDTDDEFTFASSTTAAASSKMDSDHGRRGTKRKRDQILKQEDREFENKLMRPVLRRTFSPSHSQSAKGVAPGNPEWHERDGITPEGLTVAGTEFVQTVGQECIIM